MTQEEEPKKSLLSEEEWAEVTADAYRKKNLPEDAIAKARVWERLDKQTKPKSRPSRRQTPAILLAAGVVAAVGVTRLLKNDQPGGRDKGDATMLVATLGAFILEASGDTTPVTVRTPAAGETVVFRVRAPRSGVYAFVVQEGMEPPRAVVVSAALTAEDEMVKRGDGAYGFRYDGDRTTRFCVLAEESPEKLATRVQDPGEGWTALPGESCVTL